MNSDELRDYADHYHPQRGEFLPLIGLALTMACLVFAALGLWILAVALGVVALAFFTLAVMTDGR